MHDSAHSLDPTHVGAQIHTICGFHNSSASHGASGPGEYYMPRGNQLETDTHKNTTMSWKMTGIVLSYRQTWYTRLIIGTSLGMCIIEVYVATYVPDFYLPKRYINSEQGYRAAHLDGWKLSYSILFSYHTLRLLSGETLLGNSVRLFARILRVSLFPRS
jgi:hypothetical protein